MGFGERRRDRAFRPVREVINMKPVVKCTLFFLFLLSFPPDLGFGQLLTDKQFHTYRSMYYTTQTDVSLTFSKDVGSYMDRIHEKYSDHLRRFKKDSKEKFHIRVYKEKEEFHKLVGYEKSIGAFLPNKYLLCSYLGDNSKERLFKTLRHEGFHQFMYTHISRQSPPWIDEGLAEYFEQSMDEWGNFSPEMLPEHHIHVLGRAIKMNTMIPLVQLLGMKKMNWNQRLSNEILANNQYAQSWSVVYFLLHGEDAKNSEYFNRYFKAMKKKKLAQEGIEYTFGNRMEEFVQNWLSYVKDLTN